MDYLFVIALLPVVLLLEYIYKKDTHTEPVKMIRSVFLWGCATVVPVIIFETIAEFFVSTDSGNYLELFLGALFGVAIIEEFFKWLVVKERCYSVPEFDETYDAIVYCVASSLGFAAVENVLYVVIYGFVTGLLRAVTAVPGHAAYGVIMGYFFGKAKYNEWHKKDSKTFLFASLAVPAILHAIYDYLLSVVVVKDKVIFFGIWVVYVIILFIISFKCVNKVAKLDAEQFGENKNKIEAKDRFVQIPKTCPNCGAQVQARYCAMCGRKHY